jgi:hypothetical protein
MAKIRITRKYLSDWIDNKFKELEIHFIVKEIYTTRYRGHEYEGGAAKLNITVCRTEDQTTTATMFCGMNLIEIQDYINNKGYRLKIDFNLCAGSYFLNDSELILIK